MSIKSTCKNQPPGMSVTDMRSYLAAGGNGYHYADELIKTHGVVITDPDQTVPVDVCWRIFCENAALCSDEMHGVVGTRQKPGVMNLLIGRMLLCDNLLEAILAYSAAAELIRPELETIVSRRADEIAVRWRLHGGAAELHDVALEGTAMVHYALFCWLVEDAVDVLRVRAPAARQESASTILEFLNAPVVYTGGDLEIIITAEAGQKGIVQKDLRRWREGIYQLLSTAVLTPRSPAPLGVFTRKIRAALLEGYGQKEIAQQWGLSTKTIARRLAQEGNSFRRLRDEIRMDKAASLIHAGLSIEEIGYLVGYEDPRSFRRAFVRWFGVNPSGYRCHRMSTAPSHNVPLPMAREPLENSGNSPELARA